MQKLMKLYKGKFLVTYLCNSRCKYCEDWKYYLNYPEKINLELTANEYKKFFKQVNWMKWVAITGGEPFLKKDLVDIIKYCVAFNKKTENDFY